jgi:hypothetical protein
MVHSLWNTRCLHVENRVKTTAGVCKMAPRELTSIAVAQSSLAEHARIVTKVDHHLSIMREVKAAVDAQTSARPCTVAGGAAKCVFDLKVLGGKNESKYIV